MGIQLSFRAHMGHPSQELCPESTVPPPPPQGSPIQDQQPMVDLPSQRGRRQTHPPLPHSGRLLILLGRLEESPGHLWGLQGTSSTRESEGSPLRAQMDPPSQEELPQEQIPTKLVTSLHPVEWWYPGVSSMQQATTPLPGNRFLASTKESASETDTWGHVSSHA